MSAREAINKAAANQKILPRDLIGKEKKAWEEWVQAFASGELNLRRSLHTAGVWLFENTSVTCCLGHLKNCLSEDVRKAQNDSEKRNKGRARTKRTNTTRRTKGTS